MKCRVNGDSTDFGDLSFRDDMMLLSLFFLYGDRYREGSRDMRPVNLSLKHDGGVDSYKMSHNIAFKMCSL